MAPELTDKSLHCVGCDKEFVFSAAEQEFFKERRLEHDPKRCFQCRRTRRERKGMKPSGPPNEVHSMECSDCGATDTVPFKPVEGKPVYCKSCLNRRRTRVVRNT